MQREITKNGFIERIDVANCPRISLSEMRRGLPEIVQLRAQRAKLNKLLVTAQFMEHGVMPSPSPMLFNLPPLPSADPLPHAPTIRASLAAIGTRMAQLLEQEKVQEEEQPQTEQNSTIVEF